MQVPQVAEITRTLRAWSDGQPDAEERLFDLVYGELRQLAASHLRKERQDHTLQTTGLAHEAYLKLVDQRQARWQDRSHFYRLAARVMRHILVDHARRQRAHKRWGGLQRVPLEVCEQLGQEGSDDLVAIHDALTELAGFDPVKASIVELKFFGGLSTAEMAVALELSKRSVERHWTLAKAWLQKELAGHDGC